MQQKKYIFQILHKEIKLAPKVLAFADDTNENSIDIYIGEDRPDIGLNTYSTIGLLKIITYVSQEWWRLMLSRIIVMN